MKKLLFVICLFIIPCIFQNVIADGICGINVKYTISSGTISFSKEIPDSDAVWAADCGEAFKSDHNITIMKVEDTIRVLDGKNLFSDFPYVREMYLSNLDVSGVTDMSGMFKVTPTEKTDDNGEETEYYSTSLRKIDVSGWNTANVTNMNAMFSGCFNLTDMDVSELNTLNVTDMSFMFNNCRNLTNLNVSKWRTGNVTNMHGMFKDCRVLESLDVSGWNTEKVTNMANMFFRCYKLTELDVSKWNTANVTNMGSTFNQCSSLSNLDISNWVTENVTYMSFMFYRCCALTNLDVRKWDTAKVINMSGMFSDCSALTELDVSKWNTANVTDMSGMFYDCRSLTRLDVSNWNTEKVTNMRYMFCKCSDLVNPDVSNWNTANVTDMEYMFSECSSLTKLDLTSWNTSNVNNSDGTFKECGSISVLVLGEKTLGINNIFPSLPYYKSDWYYTARGNAATDPLALNTVRKNGKLFTDYDYKKMAGVWSLSKIKEQIPLYFFPLFPKNTVLPNTGFSTNDKQLFSSSGTYNTPIDLHMTIQIPVLNTKADLVRLPYEENSWSVHELTDRAGLLDGSALPGEGYSIIAGHNTIGLEEYGPFALLSTLKVNDKVFVTNTCGKVIRFSVYANELLEPDDLQKIADISEDKPGSLILVTCENENIKGGSYLNRRVVFAKPIS